jgi:hypothetical protein
VGNEDQTITGGGHGESPSLLTTLSAASWRTFALVGGGGVALGLLVGIPIGRVTVDTNDRSPTVSSLTAAAPPVAAEPEPPPLPGSYRASFARHMPKAGKGFRRETTADGRRTARLEGLAASLRFSLVPVAGESYAVSAIVRVDGGGAAKLQPTYNGQALGSWDLTGRWMLVSSPIPPSALAGEQHEIHFAASALPKDTVIRFDSVAVLPVGDELRFATGTESPGHLIEGFSIPEARFVWSSGPRSVIGGVLSPASGAYELNVRGSAYAHIAPVSVQLTINGKAIGSASVSKKSEDIVWQIPANVLRAGTNELAFDYSNTGQPATLKPGSKDERALAMRFVSIALAPRD